MLFKISKFIKRIFAKPEAFISTQELKAGPSDELIDLRTPQELATTGVLNKAVFKNFHDDDFDQYIKQLDPNKKYIVYCKAGGRSAKAATQMRGLGLSVRDYSPGMDGWLKEKLPTKKYQT